MKMQRGRKAVSPVLATVILIAIALIASIAVSGFVFGLFGSFTSTAEVSASSVICVDNGAGKINCTLSGTNSGNANTNIQLSGSIRYADSTLGSSSVQGVLDNGVFGTAATSPQLIRAGQTTGILMQFTEAAGHGKAITGSSYTGSITLSDGGVIQFAGAF